MRAIYSYGAAAVIVLLIAAWLATGHFVAGGNGPGQGERPIIGLFGNEEEAPAPSPESQELTAEAEAKAQEAAEAQKLAEEAAKAAEAARVAARGPVDEDLRKELTAAAEAAAKAAEEAKAKSEEAAAEAARIAEAAKAAEESAVEAQHALDAALTIAERAEAADRGPAEMQSVRTQTFTIQPMQIEAPLRGRTEAKSVVSVVPETSGTATAVHVSKGQTVAKGDPLCTLDQGTRQAAVDQAAAALLQAQASREQARQQFETNQNLREEGLAPANTALQFESALKAADAQVAAAQSALDNAKAEFDRTEVVASVAGIVQDPLATVGSMLGPQAPCATIVELDPMLFVGSIPEARIGLAKLGLPAQITTVTGKKVEGTVSYIASTADQATRSFPVEIEIANPDGELRGGITAEAIVDLGSAPAHLLPQSVLTLDDDGVLGVRAVDDGVVAFHPVTILRDTREGIWVTGLPARVNIITVGQEYVLAGQRVEATNVSDPASGEEASESAQS